MEERMEGEGAVFVGTRRGDDENDVMEAVHRTNDGKSAMTAVVVDNDDEDEEETEKQTAGKRGRLGRILARANCREDDEDSDDELELGQSAPSKCMAMCLSRRVSNVSSSSSICSSVSSSSSSSCPRETRRRAPPTRSKQNSHSSPNKRQRRSRRGNFSLNVLASHIADGKNVVMVTGAGLSVNSGIRPFRGKEGLWSQVVWSKATREAFRDDPLSWYNDFWLPHFPPHTYHNHYKPNAAHEAISKIATLPNANIHVITQNIDGLHSATSHPWDHHNKLIEAHGRLGLYKCIPESDSDTDSDSDEDEDRPVKLGSRRKSRASRHNNNNLCKFEMKSSIPAHSLLGAEKTKRILNASHTDSHSRRKNEKGKKRYKHKQKHKQRITSPPLCPNCLRPAPPQALLFDEGYHSHSHYQFKKMESWISNADIVVFIGTSFAVTITDVALQHARDHNLPVFNFNIDSSRSGGSGGTANGGALESTSRLDVENIIGDVAETLPALWSASEDIVSRKYQCAL